MSVSGTNNWAVNGTASPATHYERHGVRRRPRLRRLRPATTFDHDGTSPLLQETATTLLLIETPLEEYFQNDLNVAQSRTRLTALDIGAFEHDTVGPGTGPTFAPLPPEDDGGSDAGQGPIDAGSDGGTPDAGIDGGGGARDGGSDAGTPDAGAPLSSPLNVSCSCAAGGEGSAPWGVVVGLAAVLWARRQLRLRRRRAATASVAR